MWRHNGTNLTDLPLFLNFCAWSAVSKDVLFLQRTLRGNQTKVNEFLQQTCHPAEFYHGLMFIIFMCLSFCALWISWIWQLNVLNPWRLDVPLNQRILFIFKDQSSCNLTKCAFCWLSGESCFHCQHPNQPFVFSSCRNATLPVSHFQSQLLGWPNF